MKPEFLSEESIFEQIRAKDRFIHVPYHSFDAYIRLLREAALRPSVKEIKTTLYRLAKDSKVVKALICAARSLWLDSTKRATSSGVSVCRKRGSM